MKPLNLLDPSTALLTLWFVTSAVSGAAQTLRIDRFVLSGGGGTSTNSSFSLTGTIAQPDATPALSSGRFTLEGGFWSAAIAVQVPGAPLLTITRVGSTAILSWDINATGFVVEVSDSVLGGWQPLGTTPTAAGNTFAVTVSLTPNLRFYRLRWPSTTIPVQLPGSPLLTVTRSGSSEVLSWDTGYFGYFLEYSDNLFTWQPLGVIPTVAGSAYVVTVPLSPSMRFYRLRKP